jgi:hypothetical protein
MIFPNKSLSNGSTLQDEIEKSVMVSSTDAENLILFIYVF